MHLNPRQRKSSASTEEPANFHVLTAAGLKDEAILQHSLWLVVLVAPWSPQSLSQKQRVLEAVQARDGAWCVGIRTLDGDESIVDWCPELKPDYHDPHTLILRDGEVLWKGVGETWSFVKEMEKHCLES